MPTLEVTTFAGSLSFLGDPVGSLQPLGDLLKPVKGVRSVRGGLQVEKPDQGILIIEWENLQTHRDLQGSDIFPAFVKTFQALVPNEDMSSVTQVHAEIPARDDGVLEIALDHPTTQIATMTLKPGKDKAVLGPGIENLIDWLSERARWGTVHEDENAAMVFIGWESIEKHHESVKTKADFIESNKSFFENVDPKAIHAMLNKIL